jgi:hypothetical protein
MCPGRHELLETLDIGELDVICYAAEALEADTPGPLLEV